MNTSPTPRGLLLGVRPRLTFEEYLKLPGVRASSLKALARSPKAYQHELAHPKTSRALRLGTAAHTAVLEPHRFLAEYALWDRTTKTGKTAPRSGFEWAEFQSANVRAGKTIITQAEYDHALAISRAVHADPVAKRYLGAPGDGDAEVTMLWDLDGLACKGRLDYLPKSGALVGLKTARDASAVPFGNQACKLGYDISWAFYADGHETLTGEQRRTVEIVVESAPPHDVVVYVVPDEILDRGRDQYRRLIAQLLECMAADSWPGIGDGREQTLTFPTWAFHDDDEDLGLVGFDDEKENA